MPEDGADGPRIYLEAHLSDPAGLCGLLQPDQITAILLAHTDLMNRAREAEGGTPLPSPAPGVPGAATSGPSIAPPFVATFASPEQALRCAAAIHVAARRSLATAADPLVAARLHTGIALFALSDIHCDDAYRTVSWLFGRVGAGQVLCTKAVHEELLKGDLASYFDCQRATGKAGGGGDRDRKDIFEWLHDDPVSLTNAPFEKMFAAEVAGWIRPRRELRAAQPQDPGNPQARPDGSIEKGLPFPERPNPCNDLVGLALSGGGMRSGVFSLGVVQALARHQFLEDVDYMSTVSGGAYLGASLAALWAEKLPYDGLARLGCRTRDFPFAYPRPDQPAAAVVDDRVAPAVHGNESPAMQHVRANAKLIGSSLGLFDPATWAMAGRIFASMTLLWLLFLMPLLTFGSLSAIGFHDLFSPKVTDSLSRALLFIGIIGGLVALWLILVIAHNTVWKRMNGFFQMIKTALSWFVSGLTIAVVFAAVTHANDVGEAFDGWQRWLVTLVPLELFALASVLALGGTAPGRSWRAVATVSQAASALAARTTLLLTLVLLMAGGMHLIQEFLDHGRNLKLTLGSAGAAATFALACLQRVWNTKQGKSTLWAIGIAVGGYVALGIGATMWTWRLWVWTDDAAAPWVFGFGLSVSAVLVLLVGILPSGGGLLNWLSINQIYASVLQKTWVIAARPPHGDHEPGPDVEGLTAWSNVWSREDMTIGTLRHEPERRSPYPLICTTLNLPGSQGKKLLDRKADSFVIAPIYFGSAMTRWLPTEDFDHVNNMPLAQATAISGAAATPNMGERTSTTLSVILTLLNVRMGRWIKNPRPSLFDPFKARLNNRPLALYWKEMLGMASRDDGRVYLSDGGHFENLGLYELFRRRCRYIIAVTADVGGVDEAFDLGNLGVALRRARVDFGVEANLGPMKPLMHDTTTGFVLTYYAAGYITYPLSSGGDAGPDASGILIVIKTGLVEADLTADVMNYWTNSDPSFPYDPTTDQQFDQPQFEAYRQLGFIAAQSMCRATDAAPSTRERFEAVVEAYESMLAAAEPG